MQTTKNLIMDSTCCRPAIMFCLLSLKCVVMRWDDILMDQRHSKPLVININNAATTYCFQQNTFMKLLFQTYLTLDIEQPHKA